MKIRTRAQYVAQYRRRSERRKKRKRKKRPKIGVTLVIPEGGATYGKSWSGKWKDTKAVEAAKEEE